MILTQDCRLNDDTTGNIVRLDCKEDNLEGKLEAGIKNARIVEY